MQVEIIIPFKKYEIYITGAEPDFSITYSKPKQSLQQYLEQNDFLEEVKKIFHLFRQSIFKNKQKVQKNGSLISQQDQENQDIIFFQNQNVQLHQASSGQFDTKKLSMRSQQQNQLWRDSSDLSDALDQATFLLNKKISSIVKYESEIIHLNKQIKENPNNSQKLKSEIEINSSKIKQIRTFLSKQMRNFTSKITEVIKKKEIQDIKIKRSKIKKQYFQQNTVEVYLVHQLSLPKSEIDQLKKFNCTILKQLYLCGNQIGDIGLQNLALIDLKNLKILDLQFNNLTKIEPISNFTYLQELYLADCQCFRKKQFMNLITFEETCKIFSKSQWINLKCLSINFVINQDQVEPDNKFAFKKCWSPQLIYEFLTKMIQNRENFPKLQKLQHWCSKCINNEQILGSLVQAAKLYSQNGIQLKQID